MLYLLRTAVVGWIPRDLCRLSWFVAALLLLAVLAACVLS
eukprot:gene20551-27342_t